jgi:uncharacterized SAM-dependent methyltransferase
MVLVARQSALAAIATNDCHPLVGDLSAMEDLPQILEEHAPATGQRILTFFGMLPNFEPSAIWERLSSWLRPGDLLLFSANLAPGMDYEAGMKRILPQYDNAPTREWLFTFLQNLGVEPLDGEVQFQIEACPAESGLKRVSARFAFHRDRHLVVEREQYDFPRGTILQLFYSYRYTPQLVRDQLLQRGITVLDHWIAASEEEGIFLSQRA